MKVRIILILIVLNLHIGCFDEHRTKQLEEEKKAMYKTIQELSSRLDQLQSSLEKMEEYKKKLNIVLGMTKLPVSDTQAKNIKTNGKWIEWDENGKPIIEEIWKNGSLKSKKIINYKE
jgi:uncharacterized coiled-coil protein SlyX